MKDPAICAAAGGGFHGIYRYYVPGGSIKVQYRRYAAGTLSPVKTTYYGEAYAGRDICQAGNGDLHVVIESWNSGTPEIAWSKSTDGGLTWTAPVEITDINDAKLPSLSAFGGPGSPDVVMSCADMDSSKRIWVNRYNGSSWTGLGWWTGETVNSEYETPASTQSLQDGTVYHIYTNGGKSLSYQRYNGSTWTSAFIHTEDPDPFFPRSNIAVNASGQIMATWDRNSHFWSKLYTPGSGWGPATIVSTNSSHGMVTAVPGTNNFYATYCPSVSCVRGKLFANGIWQSEEAVSVGQPSEFTLSSQVTADASGNIYAIWEYWGSQKPQAWYAVRPGSLPPPSGTLAGVVRDQYGRPVANASISTSAAAATVSGANGAYSMSVPAGTHNVNASKDYYTAQTVSGVTITQNQTTQRDFTITGNPPAAVTSFTVSARNASNVLNWRNSVSPQTNWVRVLAKTSGYPTGPSDPAATVVINRAAQINALDSATHTGLTNGTQYYYSVYACFQDASSHYAPATQATGLPAGPGDHDRDGDVDMEDFGHFQLCLTGASEPQYEPECQDAKFDTDSDVDGDDFAKFRKCFTGPNIPAAANCASL